MRLALGETVTTAPASGLLQCQRVLSASEPQAQQICAGSCASSPALVHLTEQDGRLDSTI